MKSIHLFAQKLWQKLSSQMPDQKRAQQICLTINRGANYKLLLTPNPITLGKSTFEVETRIEANRLRDASVNHFLHEHTSQGTVTHCSPCETMIKEKWFEAYYRIKQGFVPLTE